jgi:hypothetical protein
MLTRRSFLQLVPLGLLLGSRHLAGAVHNLDSPESAARFAFDLLKTRRVTEFVGQLDRGGLARFRATMLEMMDASARDGAAGEILEFFEIQWLPTLQTLSPQEFFVAFWQGLLRTMADLHEILKQADVRVVGHVLEGRTTAHVVSALRFSTAGDELPKPYVVTLQDTETGWALRMSGEPAGLTEFCRQSPEEMVTPMVQRSTHRVLGHIADGPDTAYVLCRMMLLLWGVRQTKVWALRIDRQEPEWSLLAAANRDALERFINQRHGIVEC